MKNKLLLSLIVSLFAVSAWAADVTVKETFSSINQTSSVASDTWAGDVCTWTTSYTRHKQPNWSDANYGDFINVGGSADDKMPCCWMSTNGSTQVGSISTTDFEGGIKSVSFLWAQFGKETGNTLKLKITDGTTEDFTAERDGGDGANRTAGGTLYSHTFANKTNCQLTISNASIKGGTNGCRILVGDITITPYLLYTNKGAVFQVTGSSNKYTNNDLINNTDEGDVVYSISANEIGATIDAATGEVTATDAGVVTVTASWEGVTTSYQLTILTKNATTASFTNSKLLVDVAGEVANPLSKNSTAAAVYASSNENVAIVDAASGAVTIKGVGSTTISATIPENDDYLAGEASYTLMIRDNNARKEAFSSVSQSTAVKETKVTWTGDLFDWEAQYSIRRGANDTIGGSGIQGTWIGTGDPGVLNSKEEVEGGIKYLSFRWKQWATESDRTMRLGIYAGEILKDSIEFVPAGATTHESFYFATNALMPSNAKLKIVNQSYTGASYATGTVTTGNSRFVLDTIYITPYLLYTTKAANMDTRNGLTYTNNDLIDNTTGTAVEYSIAPTGSGATIDAGTGEVTATDETEGVFTVKAKWGDVETTYTLTIVSRTATTASFAQSAVRVGLDALGIGNPLTYTDGYNGTIEYASSNTAVATVNSETGAISFAGGVGQTTITAILSQTDNYKATSASYTIYVRDNGARKEAFNGLSQSGVVGADVKDLNAGDLFAWQAQYQVRRGTNDTIWDTTTKGISIGISITPSASSILQSKGAVEGGIKYLSFYWKQWANNPDKTLRMSVYAGSTLKKADEHASTATPTYEKYLLGANEVMKSNQQLVIKNESYTGEDFEHGTLATDAARIIIDTIYITPYLLYTDKAHELYVGDTYTNSALINNTGGNDITYSLDDNDEEAEIIDASTGEVRALKAGEVTVKATWNEGGAFTTYTLTILSKVVTEASYPNAIVRLGLGEELPANAIEYSDGYDGTIAYASSNEAVATVNDEGVVSLAGGVGQATITATLPATENYEAATASYILYVRDEQARVEAFTGITGGVPSDADVHDWGGDLFMWQRQYQVRRSGNDTIHAGTDKHQATSIGVSTSPAAPSILQSKEPVEGGIKYLSFYWAQWGAANGCTRRITVYAGDEKIGEQENPNGTEGRTGEEFLLGINNAMKSNKQLIIKNESYKGTKETLADNNCRIVLDNIYITPYLLYTDKAERALRVGETDKNTSLINNTGATATFISSDPEVASVAADGTVTAVGRGKATITAKYQWNENEFVTTTYPVTVYPVNCETFDGIEQTNNYSNTTPREGDKATWTTSLGGFNVGDCGALTTNLVRFRAPNNADENAFIESSSIAGGIGAMTFDWNLGGNESTTEWDIRVFINGQLVKTLTNAEISATGAMNHFEQIAIEGINEPGNFVIRFENHSTISGTYPEGNKARFLMDNITWTSYEGTKTLAEDTNNEGWIRANGGQTVDVAISRSPLVANVWNTLCLPFAISKSTDLDGADVKEMTGVAMVGDVLEIYFSDITGDELQAGKPYLVKPTADKDISGTYSDKQISSIASPVKNGDVTMQGMFSPVAVTKDDYNTLFVGTPDGEGNNLFYPQADGTLRGLRAYFKIGGAPLSAPRRARYVVTQKDVVTGIESVQNSDVRIQKIIRDGQLFIIRDGKMYNAQGQVIK